MISYSGRTNGSKLSLKRLCLCGPELPAGNRALCQAMHERALLTEVKSTAYEDLDAQAFLRILAEVSS